MPSIVNLDNVAWMESNEDGSTRVLFAVMLTHTEHEGAALSIDVRESLQEIAVLSQASSGAHPKRPLPRRGQTRPLDVTRMTQRNDDGDHPRALHELLNDVPDDRLDEASTVLTLLTVPEVHEPLSDEELSVDSGRARCLRAGRGDPGQRDPLVSRQLQWAPRARADLDAIGRRDPTTTGRIRAACNASLPRTLATSSNWPARAASTG